jgi:hypothetical protein
MKCSRYYQSIKIIVKAKLQAGCEETDNTLKFISVHTVLCDTEQTHLLTL